VEGIGAYLWAHSYLDVSLRPDGGEVAYVAELSGARRGWRRPVDGGPARLLVLPSDRDARRVAWNPAGSHLAVGVGGERVFVVDAAGRDTRELGAREASPLRLGTKPWSPDGGVLAVASGAGTLALLDVERGLLRALLRAPCRADAHAWSCDGRFLCAALRLAPDHDDVIVVDRETGGVEPLTADRPAARRTPLGFTGDGSALYLLSDEGREHPGLARLDRRTGEFDWVKTPEWDVDIASMSDDGRWILYGVNEDASHRLRLLDRNSGREPELPALPQGACYAAALTPDGTRAAVLWSSSGRPAGVLVFDLVRRTLQEVTRGDDPEPRDAVDAQAVRVESFDRKIPALLYRPGGAGPGAPGAVVLSPEGPARADYKPLVQLLVSRGILVLVPTVRGSPGYGRSFERLARGGDEWRDAAAAAHHLVEHEGVAPDRLLLLGSHGRALECAHAGGAPWRAAVDLGGLPPPRPAPLPYLPVGEGALEEAAEFLLAHA